MVGEHEVPQDAIVLADEENVSWSRLRCKKILGVDVELGAVKKKPSRVEL
jgi:hypothetical protein